MYRAALKKEELVRTQADTVEARIRDNPNGFSVVRAAFGATLVNYASQNRGIAANIMHFISVLKHGVAGSSQQLFFAKALGVVHI